MDQTDMVYGVSLLNDHDIYLLKEGNHFRLYEKMGSHVITVDDVEGAHFAVWAPNAERVSVIGDFNQWNKESHPLKVREDESGIWEGFIPRLGNGAVYKYHIASKHRGYQVDKGDPFAFRWEEPPKTASVVWDLSYEWRDGEWMKGRKAKNDLAAPVAIYEMHHGSWRRVPEEDNRALSYREMAGSLPGYLKMMEFTHVEFLPVRSE
ncbi:MAG: 1,4-alpha-glucan branching enzyme, partial [Desulforhabdus sp.]|nr:1,4-alpha-glucan branching enzyme [Desulforhabdus sp.]